MHEARLVLKASALLGEGPQWVAEQGRLWWLDLQAPEIHRFDPASGRDETVWRGPAGLQIGALVPRAKGGFILAASDGIYALGADGGTPQRLLPAELEAGMVFNDGRADSRGRLWLGTWHLPATDARCGLVRFDADGSRHPMTTDILCSNGPAFSADGRTLYAVDTYRRLVQAYACDPATGTLGAPEVFARFEEADGYPDGLAVDVTGHVWVAQWDGGCVTRFDPFGRVERKVQVPVNRVTSCGFGGPDRKTLFITTARCDLTEAELQAWPLSGSLFAYEAPAAGLPEHAAAL
jgi:sugar lactone lactonase YvrE